MEDVPVLRFKVDERPYHLDAGKLTGRELLDFQNAVGMPLGRAMQGGVDTLVWIAGVKWLLDRRLSKGLKFDEVLDVVTLDQVEFASDEEEVPPDPPTQEGDSLENSPRSLTSTASSLGR